MLGIEKLKFFFVYNNNCNYVIFLYSMLDEIIENPAVR